MHLAFRLTSFLSSCLDDDTRPEFGHIRDDLISHASPATPLLIGHVGPMGDGLPRCFNNAERPRPLIDCCLDKNNSCPVQLNSTPTFYGSDGVRARSAPLQRKGASGV